MGRDLSVKILTVGVFMLLTKAHDTPPLCLINSQLQEFLFYFNNDNDVHSAFTLTNMVVGYFTKAGPFFFWFCCEHKQPEDKITNTFINPFNTVNKTLVQTKMRMLSV